MRFKCTSCEGLHPRNTTCPICGGKIFKDLFVKANKPVTPKNNEEPTNMVVNGELTNIFLNLGIQ